MGFVREWPVKSVRKQHLCEVCGTHIEKGEPAIRWSGITDDYFSSAIYHPECRAAEIEHNREASSYADEWYRLDEDGSTHVRDWLKAHHPIVAERMFGKNGERA